MLAQIYKPAINLRLASKLYPNSAKLEPSIGPANHASFARLINHCCREGLSTSRKLKRAQGRQHRHPLADPEESRGG